MTKHQPLSPKLTIRERANIRTAEKVPNTACEHVEAGYLPPPRVRRSQTQQNAGHASLHTTTRYVTTEDARRRAAMKKFWGAQLPAEGDSHSIGNYKDSD